MPVAAQPVAAHDDRRPDPIDQRQQVGDLVVQAGRGEGVRIVDIGGPGQAFGHPAHPGIVVVPSSEPGGPGRWRPQE